MAESVAERRGGRGSGDGGDSPRPAGSDDSFAQLRSIIVGPERRDLRALQAHLLDPTVQTRDVSRVLPDALQLRAHDPQLMRALAPSVESAITASVRRDPQPLADALFPVIGPAIRKAVAHTIAAMMESVNLTLDRRFSLEALNWRLTAWRTGRPFAEIVLLNTLEYRVEQMFLIHRDTGLLLQHVAIDRATARDADQISAMLTAIRDFARDSFNVQGAESIESMRIGDLSVVVEQGPHAIVAAVVRGAIPADVRVRFQDALESIHRQFGPALQSFSGDAAVFADAAPILEACLVSQERARRRPPTYRRWAVATVLLVAAIGVWLFLDLRDRQRFDTYLQRLNAEPGIVVLSSGRRAGKFFVAGLRDPMAADPESLIPASLLSPASVTSRWEPYQALHPPFVAARAALLLRPPDGVSLAFDQGVLRASGPAPQRWIADTERLAPAIAGVRRFEFAGETAERRLAAQIENVQISFSKGDAAVEDSQGGAIESVLARLRELDTVLAAAGQRARLEVIGNADSDGPDDLNSQLSQRRADTVAALLRAATLDRIAISARGLGRAPIIPGATEADHQRNRRVSFRILLSDDPGGRSPSP